MLSRTLIYMYPGIDLERDVIVVEEGSGPYIARWNDPRPQPTPEEIEAARPAAEAWWARRNMPTLTPAQLDLALLHFGLLDTVEAFVTAADRATQIAYRRVQTFERSNPLLNAAAQQLGMSDEQMDGIWMFGAAITPGA